jgi:hypothetical protein
MARWRSASDDSGGGRRLGTRREESLAQESNAPVHGRTIQEVHSMSSTAVFALAGWLLFAPGLGIATKPTQPQIHRAAAPNRLVQEGLNSGGDWMSRVRPRLTTGIGQLRSELRYPTADSSVGVYLEGRAWSDDSDRRGYGASDRGSSLSVGVSYRFDW